MLDFEGSHRPSTSPSFNLPDPSVCRLFACPQRCCSVD